MNPFALLPLTAFFLNIFFAIYIFFNNPKDKLNRLYSLVTISVAIWAWGHYSLYSSAAIQEAINANKLGVIGSYLTAIFLLHFFIAFAKKPVKRITLIGLYLLVFLIGILAIFTNLIVESAKPSVRGYSLVPGPLYIISSSIVAIYTIIGLVLCYKYYLKSSSNERNQAKLIIIGVIIPLVFGISMEIIPALFGKQVFQITATMSTITVAVMAYAMMKYKLMTITPEMAIDKILETMSDNLIVINNETNIALINPSCLLASGYQMDELKGKGLGAIFPEEKRIISKIMEEESIYNLKTDMVTKKGEKLQVSINGSKMMDKSGDLKGYVLVMRDVRETESLINSLEEKTKELDASKTALEGSKKELESKIRELEKFNRISVGRELRVAELKKKIRDLEEKNKENIKPATNKINGK